MSEAMWFDAGGERTRGCLQAALAWCEECWFVTKAPVGATDGSFFWDHVRQYRARVRGAILSNLESADRETVDVLRQTGSLRRFVDDATVQGHFVWFERGDEVRLLVAPDSLAEMSPQRPGLWFFWEGPRALLPEGLSAILAKCQSSSAIVEGDWKGAPESAATAKAPKYSRPIPSVREVLGIRSTRDFFELEAEDQERALWSTLIGEGPVDLEQAVRLGAERLRAQGFLEYQVLRQDGRVHSAIEERLLAARRSTDLFDRPKNGFVRAIQLDMDALTAEQWRDCVVSGLNEHVRVDRDHAVRLGFAYAQSVYGVEAQRLRGGGRADQALRSAVNSAIRQGYLERDGAAYLLRVSETAAPTLRGVVEPDTKLEPDSTETTAAPAEPGPTVYETVALEPTQPEPTVAPATSDLGPAPVVETSRAEPEAGSPLDRSLWELDFPTRTLNWAERQGIETLRAFLSWQPEAFENERNVGRRTVRETRERIEAVLGCSWEAARRSVQVGGDLSAGATGGPDDDATDGTTETLTAGGASGWANLSASLTDEQRDIPLGDVALPTRMRHFVQAQALNTLGDLFRLTHAALSEQPNLGRKSLNDTLDAVRDFFSEQSSPPVFMSFLEAFHAQLAALEPIPRMIVTRRAGIHGARETLEELGSMLGVTRERVRQIEARVIERLRDRSHFRRSVESRLADAFGPGKALPLDLLAQDPWWAGVDGKELLLDYVARRIFEDELFVLEAPSGKRYLTRFPPEAFAERLESANSRVAKLEFPVELSAIDAILHSEVDSLDPVLFTELERAVDELLHVDAERPDFALGYGRHRDDEVVAFLNSQEAPIPIALVEERCGRGRLPEEVLYFKRGVVGLKRHFPEFDAWMERLVPAALEVMKERPAGRQWLVPEIHEALHERGLVPEWLGHWHLASLLRLSKQVDYLGRLRVAAKESGQEQRLQYEETLESLLEEAGGPLDFTELLDRARVRTDISDGGAASTVISAPFVRLDDRRIGLVERDIPGGPQAVAGAIEAVVQKLNETERGLTPHQATQLVNALSADHATWTRQLVTSVLRNEPSVRIDRSKNIGLDDWDDVRCPTRPEFVRREVQRAGGTLSIAALVASMEEVFGRAPDRSSLGVLVTQVGLTITGDTIVRPASVAPEAAEAPISRAGINLSGVPIELRQMFEELVQQPLSSVPELRAEIDQHVRDIENEHRVNEFVDLPAARSLAGRCHRLLDRWESLPPVEKHLAHAAVRYFVSWNDLENDLNIGGLDDDQQIVNAVLSYLGMLDEESSARAS
jgi:hypothetical protein